MIENIENLIKVGKYKEANEVLDEYLKKNPYDENAWIYKGIIFQKSNLIEKAEGCFDKALEINPNNYKCWFYKAIALRKKEPFGNWFDFYYKSYEMNEDSKEINEDLEIFVKESLKGSSIKRDLEDVYNFLNYFVKASITRKLKKEVYEIVKIYEEIEKFKVSDIPKGFLGVLILSLLAGMGLALLPAVFISIIFLSPILYFAMKFEENRIKNLERKYENYLWIGAIREEIDRKWRTFQESFGIIKLSLIIFIILFILGILALILIFILSKWS